MDEVAHLGPVVAARRVVPPPGPPGAVPAPAARIVALGTSAVFGDPTLLQTFWDTDAARLDSGIQAHMFTRPGDMLVLQVPRGDEDDVAHQVALALDAGRATWRAQCGVELLGSRGRIVLAGAPARSRPWTTSTPTVPVTMRWHPGGMLDAAAATWRAGAGSLVAFVLDDALVARLQLDPARHPELVRRARRITGLMDKNVAMSVLSAAGVPCAPTWTVDDGDPGPLLRDLEDWERRSSRPRRYVFKPAGGAAGIGVHAGQDGAGLPMLADHLGRLQETGTLPERFQVQEFLPGDVLGVGLWVDGAGGHDVREVHKAVADRSGRFVGATWLRADRRVLAARTQGICASFARAVDVPMLVGLDVVDGRVIEVNPRLTAAAPIAHLLHEEPVLVDGGAFERIERIDLDARVSVARGAIAEGRVAGAAQVVRDRFGALVLPQGVNPFGPTRVVVVNDVPDGAARHAFRELVRG